ncbi:MAG: tRNA (N(6)-L-threonylcarbamoyladenosine(37)-C(2))-methylthiotransferase MtaB [Spirochaetales bacterium]|nr:MAG: tRNA (N(6)-L-threonylcarbamoyladenosine(37)-C(2))-methylthiotransferase MtaB [Spirochaetales bacterium]
MSFSVSFRTFGCRLNQTETEGTAGAFAHAGARIVSFGEPADVVVFNTCTVTGKAEQKARREMRLALRRNPDAVLLATGCYAEMEPGAIAALAPRVVVLPGSRKSVLAKLATALYSAHAEGFDPLDEARRIVAESLGTRVDPFWFSIGDFRLRSRASLKIQDGCDNRCAYCRVCLARGGSVSLDPAEVVRRARGLAAAGYPEIVLTGVNLSQYSSGGRAFPDLLEILARETDTVAYRVSSWEPDRVDDAFLRAFASPRVRPHLHLAVQSGADPVLRAMGRAYRCDDVLRAAASVRSAKGDPFIGADLIVGFPGETDEDFSATMDFLAALDPAWVHVFPFSPRPGTRAWSMKPKIPERVAALRAAEVAAFATKSKRRFSERRIGNILEAVLETGGYGDEEPAEAGPCFAIADKDSSILHPAALTAAPVLHTRALSADYLKLEVHGVPAGYRGACRCRATAPGMDDSVDLLAEFVE